MIKFYKNIVFAAGETLMKWKNKHEKNDDVIFLYQATKKAKKTLLAFKFCLVKWIDGRCGGRCIDTATTFARRATITTIRTFIWLIPIIIVVMSSIHLWGRWWVCLARSVLPCGCNTTMLWRARWWTKISLCIISRRHHRIIIMIPTIGRVAIINETWGVTSWWRRYETTSVLSWCQIKGWGWNKW